MKKLSLLTMCASAGLMLLTACTATDELAPVAQESSASSDAVSFGVLTREAEPTRSGYPGEIGLQTLRNVGFGVFACITENTPWDFMDNQQVVYNGGWTYSPVKYWPNTGGGLYQEVKFFAYAPYVPYQAPDNKVVEDNTYGIVKLPNASTSDYTIDYIVPDDPAQGVDLLYGVAARDYNDGEMMGGSSSVSAGSSPIKLSKLLVGDKVEWEFKHALTKFGVTVDAVIDDVRTGNNGTGVLDPNTRILIESLAISPSLSLYKTGTLNLDQTNGSLWSNTDNRFDEDDNIATNLKYPTTISDFASLPLGVNSSMQSLYESSGYGNDNAFMLISSQPDIQNSNMQVSITYHVITRDDNLNGGYSDIQHEVSQSVNVSYGPGYRTMLHLHLGLTSVKMDATTTDWDGNEAIFDLPANAKVTAFNVTSGSIDASGLIGGTFEATTTNGNLTLEADEVSFTWGSTKLIVTEAGASEYYLPGNYSSSARDIYPSFGGVRAAAISQPALTTTDFTITNPTNVTAGSTADIDITVPSNDFKYSDWTFSSPDGLTVDGASWSSSPGAGQQFRITVEVPTGTAGPWNWTLTHKEGLQLTGSITAAP